MAGFQHREDAARFLSDLSGSTAPGSLATVPPPRAGTADCIGTTPIDVNIPGWAVQWFSRFPNVETIVAQVSAVTIMLGSYLTWQYLRVWRPRRCGQQAAQLA